jgi:hypothetical protein
VGNAIESYKIPTMSRSTTKCPSCKLPFDNSGFASHTKKCGNHNSGITLGWPKRIYFPMPWHILTWKWIIILFVFGPRLWSLLGIVNYFVWSLTGQLEVFQNTLSSNFNAWSTKSYKVSAGDASKSSSYGVDLASGLTDLMSHGKCLPFKAWDAKGEKCITWPEFFTPTVISVDLTTAK